MAFFGEDTESASGDELEFRPGGVESAGPRDTCAVDVNICTATE